MNKIYIYYGPKKDFKELISDKCNIKTLSELAKYSDSTSREFTFRIDKDDDESQNAKEKLYVDCLVCYSEEYSGITESAIHSFLSFLYQFDLNEVYLQNPPIYIESQLRNANLDVELHKHEYSKINKNKLREIARDFTNTITGQEGVKDCKGSIVISLICIM